MSKVILRKNNRDKRKLKVRGKIFGTKDKPRLTVFRSIRYIYGQIVDDTKRITLIDVSSQVKKLHEGKKKTEAAYSVGLALALKAKEKNIINIVFDRNGYKYHGRVKSFAEGVRKGGLIF